MFQKEDRFMSAHDRNLIMIILAAAALVSLNFLAVITGAADGYYDQLSELLGPLLGRY
jgi:7-cyano-7-deazaguanine synthase in queuosine biosynthesis